jgi:hypothetical protein
MIRERLLYTFQIRLATKREFAANESTPFGVRESHSRI